MATPKTQSTKPPQTRDPATAPLYSLVFILPVIAAFELGLLLYPELVHDIRARRILSLTIESLGAPALYAAPILILAVLLAAHILRKDPWSIRPPTLARMTAESIALAIPLFIIGQIAALLLSVGNSTAQPAANALNHIAAQTTTTPPPDAAQSLFQDIAHACGAGLYEEFVFRFAAIATLHFVAHDLCGMKKTHAAAAALVLSSLAFALYHDLQAPDGSFLAGRAAFLFLAGLYFGAVYLLRGFGIAVAAHAVYDILAFQAAP